MSRIIRLTTLAAVLALPTAASAHSWYPAACCYDFDCAPADKVEVADDGQLIVTTEHGKAIIPATLERRESKDHRVHDCIVKDDKGKSSVRCIFLPPTD